LEIADVYSLGHALLSVLTNMRWFKLMIDAAQVHQGMVNEVPPQYSEFKQINTLLL
jgi:hypothetical protein